MNHGRRNRLQVCPALAHARNTRARGGYVLVTVAVMIFALMALAALVIDFGFVRLTQRQMLAATDAAAIEGLRWRDVQYQDELPLAWQNNPAFWQAIGATEGSGEQFTPAQQDAIRRWAATNTVSMMMSTPASDAGDTANYGFGPVVQITATAAGGGLAGPTIAPGQPPVYQPQLQTNSGNATEGDVVSGYYGPDQPGVEQANYTRNDYSPVASSYSGTQPPSMLVRMRRVAPGNSLDSEPGVSSSGDAVPYLFAYGAPIDRTSVAQGTTVRGTSIASVGPPTNDANYADYQTFGMTSSVGWPYSWTDPGTQKRQYVVGAVLIAIPWGQWPATITLTADASSGTIDQTSAGFLVASGAAPTQVSQSQAVVIGQQAAGGAGNAPSLAGQPSVYVLLVDTANSNQVVGFGAADVSYGTLDAPTQTQSITLTPAPGRIAWSNASASLVQQLAEGVTAGSLWQTRASIAGALYSPVLVNRLGPVAQ